MVAPGGTGSGARIRFVAGPVSGGEIVGAFGEFERIALCEGSAPAALLADGEPPDGALDIIHLPGGAATPIEERRSAEAWLGADGTETLQQSDRILWRPGRALVIGASDRLADYRFGLAHFAFHEGELRRLEASLAGWWKIAADDIALTHQVRGVALRRWPHVNEMTKHVTRARMDYVALVSALNRPPAALPGTARRVVAEFAAQIGAAQRLEDLDERLEVVEDLYELANDRLSEYAYFRHESVLEIIIIAMLALEAVLILVGWS